MTESLDSPVQPASERKDIPTLQAMADAAHRSNDVAQELEIWKSIVELAPSGKNQVQLARLYEAADQYERALRIFESLLAAVPKHLSILTHVADLYCRLGQTEAATDKYRRALEVQPDSPSIAIALADVLWDAQPGEAISVLEQSLTRHTKQYSATLQILVVVARLTEWQARRERQLPVHHALIFDEFPFAFSQSVLDRLDIASAAWISAEPNSAVALLYRAMSELAQRNYTAADQMMLRYERFAPNEPKAAMRFLARPPSQTPILPPVEVVRTADHRGLRTIFLCCDDLYLERFGFPLLKSIQKNAPGMEISIHLMSTQSPRESAKTDILQRLDQLAGLNMSITREYPSQFMAAHQISARHYYGAVRFIRFAEKLETENSTLLMVDVDALLNKNAARIFDLPGDIALRIRAGRTEPWNQFSACIVMAKNNDAARMYFRVVANIIGNAFPRLWWGIDQYAMFAAYLTLQQSKCQPLVTLLGPDDADLQNYSEASTFWFVGGQSRKALFTGIKSYGGGAFRRYEDIFKSYQQDIPTLSSESHP